MKIRGHGNAIAITLAALAVVLATTGTAVAVTISKVRIADAKSPSHVARVDKSGHLSVATTGTETISDPNSASHKARVDATGRLQTAGPVSTLHARTYGFAGGVITVMSKTTASIAVTGFSYDNTYNTVYAGTDYDFTLEKVTVGSSGGCSDIDATTTAYRSDGVLRGASVSQSFPAPLVFTPTGSKAYCIGVSIDFVDASHPTPYYATIVSLSGYVVSGSYNGAGSAARPAAVPAGMRPRLKR